MTKNISSIEEDKMYLEEFKSGRTQVAFEKIYKKYQKKIRFKLLIASQDEELADDLSSEIFIKVYQKLSSFDDEKGCFNTWISTIATNTYRDYLRKKALVSEVSIDSFVTSNHDDDDGVGFRMELKSDCLTPLQIMSQMDMTNILQKVIELSLKNETMKKLVDMQYFQEMSLEEISMASDTPIGTVKSQLFRAKNLMVSFVKQNGGKSVIYS